MVQGGAHLIKRVLAVGGVMLLATAVGAFLSFVLLTRTNAGQTLVLERVLKRIDGVVNGEIGYATRDLEVGDIDSRRSRVLCERGGRERLL